MTISKHGSTINVVKICTQIKTIAHSGVLVNLAQIVFDRIDLIRISICSQQIVLLDQVINIF